MNPQNSGVESEDLGQIYLQSMRTWLNFEMSLGEKAIAQLDDEQLNWTSAPDGNSVAILVKHVRGNLKSRWTDALTSDGEKPDRDRDSEFVLEEPVNRDVALKWWEEARGFLLRALESLNGADLLQNVYIRSERLTLLDAINRSALHTAYHVGQIVHLARTLCGGEWKTLSIPRGQSTAYLRAMRAKHGGRGNT